MASIALFVHWQRPEAHALARDLSAWLAERGHEVRLPAGDAELIGHPELGWDLDDIPAGLDLALSLGGDGSILRTVAAVSVAEVPVLGVNLGQLGYLAEVEPDGARLAISRFLAGSHTIERRMMLGVTGMSPDVSGVDEHALNEMVIARSPESRMINVEVSVDGAHFTTFRADGVIAATPTGSTAYSLSVRGPVVAPTHKAILVTPVAPHGLWDRTLVLDPANRVEFRLVGERPAVLSIDGRNVCDLAPDDTIRCRVSERSARLVTFASADFLSVIRQKFGLDLDDG